MARISVKAAQGRYFVTLRGQLSAGDLGRLERACGPALELEDTPVTLRLTEISEIDEPAQALLDRLAARGAVVVRD